MILRRVQTSTTRLKLFYQPPPPPPPPPPPEDPPPPLELLDDAALKALLKPLTMEAAEKPPLDKPREDELEYHLGVVFAALLLPEIVPSMA